MVKISYHVTRLLAGMMYLRPVRLSAAAGGVVSFTFDDFPASASVGADILVRAGARGTFYLSTSRLASVGPQGMLADDALVRRLSEDGHEIGCHTRSHLRASDTRVAIYRADMEANKAALNERFGIIAHSFAYPFGSVTPAAKKAAGRLYRTGRTTVPGINMGTFDATFLRANPLYGIEMTGRLAEMLGACGRRGGWLILYVHDVARLPSAYGCRPELLADAVRLAKSAGCRILPVHEVELVPGRDEKGGDRASVAPIHSRSMNIWMRALSVGIVPYDA